MRRSEQRILTTHVGSLIRPKSLLDLARDPDPGRRDAHERERKRAWPRWWRARPRPASTSSTTASSANPAGRITRLSDCQASSRPDKLYEAVWLGRDRHRFAEFWPRAHTSPAGSYGGADLISGRARLKAGIHGLRDRGFLDLAARWNDRSTCRHSQVLSAASSAPVPPSALACIHPCKDNCGHAEKFYARTHTSVRSWNATYCRA